MTLRERSRSSHREDILTTSIRRSRGDVDGEGGRGVDHDDDQPPICPVCGVTMVPAALSGRDDVSGDWVCLECEETDAEEE